MILTPEKIATPTTSLSTSRFSTFSLTSTASPQVTEYHGASINPISVTTTFTTELRRPQRFIPTAPVFGNETGSGPDGWGGLGPFGQWSWSVPVSSTTSGPTSSATAGTTTNIQASGRNRPISTLVPAIVGSIVGALVLGICVFLCMRRQSQHRKVLHKITPWTDTENISAIQPTSRHLVRPEKQAIIESEVTAQPRTQHTQHETRLQLEHRHLNDQVNDHENAGQTEDDHDAGLQLQVAEIRVTVGRMMEQVHQIEAQMGSSVRERGTESVSSLDEPPPTYVS
ncbi:hypothetical protein D9757_012982 [Collybiopsis confluens]|uniref:Epidermal growth factor receptor-like transmembrane-juxtamembrane segment domain-containing protein n=1 Tax=Collybiopsis confluens TaxID=2823264 RepID=A0A8H5GIU5_9AGAR|nr:hypothetical protein D9757_012982 [Collybiopsis confluens]